MQGIIKWFNEKKGFGFVVGEDGTEYFVHISKIINTKITPKENDKVDFEPKETMKGKQAFDVQLI
jgi:CspA family cold shock protein